MMSTHFSKLLAACALLIGACTHDVSAPAHETVGAEVVTAQRLTVPAFHAAAGTVRAEVNSTLAANAAGTVTRVLVAEGDHVRAGDVLVEIDARARRAEVERSRAGGEAIEQAIEAAAANARLAEVTHQRYLALRERGSASQQEYDEAKTRHAAAQAELARLVAGRAAARAATTQAVAVLDDSRVRAPIDGVISERFVDPGAQAAPGVPLLAIQTTAATRVDTTVPEDVAVRAGDPAFVEADGRRVEARVLRVQPSIDSAARSALVQLRLGAPLRAGSYVKVLFPTGSRDAISIPSVSLVRHGQLTSVFAVGADGVARMRLVTVRAIDDARSEVLSGLSAGEAIVTEPARVRDGVVIRRGA